MKLSSWIWLGTFSIVGVAIATKTNFLKNLINKVKNPPHGFFYYDGGNGGAGAYGSGGGGGGGVMPDVPSRGSTRQSWGSGNFPQGGYYDPLVNERYPSVINSQYLPNEPSEPNFTQPLVPPNINKEIESQQPKKQHHHKKKNQKATHESQQPDQVYTQVECPSDPNSVPCGYNCYMNGQLMTVDCTTPYYYNPYRSGGPPTGPGPSQNNIHPTTPDQNLQNNNSQYNPYAASHNQPGKALFYLDTPSGASKPGSYRMNGDSRNVSPHQSYGIYANVTTGSGGGGYSPGLEITSGGPGSAEGNCCGITIGIHASGSENGKPFIATEDWTLPGKDHQGKHTYICGGHQPGQPRVGPCPNTSGQSTFNVRNTTVPMSWHVDQKTEPGNILYCGRLDGKSGCGPGYFAMARNPTKNGQRILPNALGNGPDMIGKSASDPSRVRADDLGNPDFGRPVAYAE